MLFTKIYITILLGSKVPWMFFQASKDGKWVIAFIVSCIEGLGVILLWTIL